MHRQGSIKLEPEASKDRSLNDGLFQLRGAEYIPMPAAEGPWMPGALSGSAVAPLLAGIVDGIDTPRPMMTSRLALAFLRPVPMAPLVATHEIIREGRKQQLLLVRLSSGGKVVAMATAVRLRVEKGTCRFPEEYESDFSPPDGDAFDTPLRLGNPLFDLLDSRLIGNTDPDTGSREAWFRFRGSIVGGKAITPLERAAMFSDFGNGLAPVLDPMEFTFLNADVTLHLARLPRGEWLHLKSRTLNGDQGLGMVATELGDAEGLFGWAHQSLLFEARDSDPTQLSDGFLAK